MISVDDVRAAVERGCGDHSCRFVKPSGMGTNGGCRCLGQRSAQALIRDLVELVLALAPKETLEQLVARLDIPVMEPSDVLREKRRVEDALCARHGVSRDGILHALSNGRLPEDELVAEWLSLDALLGCQVIPSPCGDDDPLRRVRR